MRKVLMQVINYSLTQHVASVYNIGNSTPQQVPVSPLVMRAEVTFGEDYEGMLRDLTSGRGTLLYTPEDVITVTIDNLNGLDENNINGYLQALCLKTVSGNT